MGQAHPERPGGGIPPPLPERPCAREVVGPAQLGLPRADRGLHGPGAALGRMHAQAALAPRPAGSGEPEPEALRTGHLVARHADIRAPGAGVLARRDPAHAREGHGRALPAHAPQVRQIGIAQLDAEGGGRSLVEGGVHRDPSAAQFHFHPEMQAEHAVEGHPAGDPPGGDAQAAQQGHGQHAVLGAVAPGVVADLQRGGEAHAEVLVRDPAEDEVRHALGQLPAAQARRQGHAPEQAVEGRIPEGHQGRGRQVGRVRGGGPAGHGGVRRLRGAGRRGPDEAPPPVRQAPLLGILLERGIGPLGPQGDLPQPGKEGVRWQGLEGLLEEARGGDGGRGGPRQFPPLHEEREAAQVALLAHFPLRGGDPGFQGGLGVAVDLPAGEADGVGEAGQGVPALGLQFHRAPLLGREGEGDRPHGPARSRRRLEARVQVVRPENGPFGHGLLHGRAVLRPDPQEARPPRGPLGLPFEGLLRELHAPGEDEGPVRPAPGGLLQLLPDGHAHAGEGEPFPALHQLVWSLPAGGLGGPPHLLAGDPLAVEPGLRLLRPQGQTGQEEGQQEGGAHPPSLSGGPPPVAWRGAPDLRRHRPQGVPLCGGECGGLLPDRAW